jgi:hypothetical protein
VERWLPLLQSSQPASVGEGTTTLYGSLSLLSPSPSLDSSVVLYEDQELSFSLPLHRVLVDSKKDRSIILIHKSQQLFLQARTSSDYDQFLEGLILARDIQNVYLDLNILYRDLYTRGFSTRSTFDKIDMVELNQSLVDCSKAPFLTAPKPAAPPSAPTPSPPGILKSSNRTNETTLHFLTLARCIYCDKRPIDVQTDLKIHPYVPIDAHLNVLYLCLPCHSNYSTYRQNAIKQKLLILPGEVNEEICACCSDSPSLLVLCSSCPRSFCEPCLVRILSTQEFSRMKTQSNWRCMCCLVPQETMVTIRQLLSHPSSSPSTSPLHGRGVAITNSTLMSGLGEKNFASLEGKGSRLVSHAPTPAGKITPGKALDYKPPPGFTTSPSNPPRSLPSTRSDPPPPLPPWRSTGRQCAPQPMQQLEVTDTEPHSRSTAKRQRRQLEKEEAVASVTSPPSSHSQRGGKKNRQSVPLEPSVPLPPVEKSFDEVYYFCQYANYLDDQSPTEEEGEDEVSTEDYCFLCKDGGELIECDHRRKQAHQHCRKVYHSYCLGFQIEEDGCDWKCMRHYCGVCGLYNPNVSCRYCPNSSCEDCFLATSQAYGMLSVPVSSSANPVPGAPAARLKRNQANSKPDTKHHHPVGSKAPTGRGSGGRNGKSQVEIVCSNCLRLIERCKQRHIWKTSLHPRYTPRHCKGDKGE